MDFNNGDFWSLLLRIVEEFAGYYNEKPKRFNKGFVKALKLLSFTGLIISVSITVFLIKPLTELVSIGIEPKLYLFIAFVVLICSYTIYISYTSYKVTKAYLL